MLSTDPAVLRTDPAVLRTDPTVLRTDPTVLRLHAGVPEHYRLQFVPTSNSLLSTGHIAFEVEIAAKYRLFLLQLATESDAANLSAMQLALQKIRGRFLPSDIVESTFLSELHGCLNRAY